MSDAASPLLSRVAADLPDLPKGHTKARSRLLPPIFNDPAARQFTLDRCQVHDALVSADGPRFARLRRKLIGISHESYKDPGCRARSTLSMLTSFAVATRVRAFITDVRSVLRQIKHPAKSTCRACRRGHVNRSARFFVAARLSNELSTGHHFDYLHWTLAYAVAATLAWMGVRRARGAMSQRGAGLLGASRSPSQLRCYSIYRRSHSARPLSIFRMHCS